MSRLTARRCNGIKQGFWSHARTEEVMRNEK